MVVGAAQVGKWVAAGAGLFAVLGLLIWRVVDPGDQNRPIVGRLAPRWEMVGQDGRTHRLEDYAKRPVLLIFFSGLNPAAREGLISLAKTARNFDLQSIKTFAVFPATVDPAALRAFHEAEKLPIALLTDRDGRAANEYQVKRSQSRAVVIGRRGTVLEAAGNLQSDRLGEQLLNLTLCCVSPTPPNRQMLGRQVPNITAKAVGSGESVELLPANSRSRATVVLFLSARCPCSRGYEHRLATLWRDYQSDQARFVGVYSCPDETEAEIAAVARESGLPFPLLHDPNGKLANLFEARMTPEAFVLDSGGVVRYHGRIDDNRDEAEVRTNDLRNALEPVLVGRLPRRNVTPGFGCAIPVRDHAGKPD